MVSKIIIYGRKPMKRFASLILAALLAVSLLTAPASALTLAEVQATHPAVLPAPGAPVAMEQQEKDALHYVEEAKKALPLR